MTSAACESPNERDGSIENRLARLLHRCGQTVQKPGDGFRVVLVRFCNNPILNSRFSADLGISDMFEVPVDHGKPGRLFRISVDSDVLVVDNKSGLETVRAWINSILKAYPGVRVIVVTDAENVRKSDSLLSRGLRGYVLRPFAIQELMVALSAVNAGFVVMRGTGERGKRLKVLLTDDAEVLDDGSSGCVNVKETLELVARGWSNKQIAKSLGLTVPCLESRFKRLFASIGVRNRAEAVAWFLQL